MSTNAELDFDRPFLPGSLVDSDALPFLAPDERLTLNHIRAAGYLATFGLVEEFILPFVLERLQARAGADMDETRALLAFAGEEAKHIALFRRFRDVFDRGFGHRCDVIGPASAIAEHVLGHSALGVGLLILHIEWMTQRHWVEAVRDDVELEPAFRRLLHQHWLEESQHARIDGWIVEAVAADASPTERAQAFEDYRALLAFLDDGLAQQVEFDLDALERATGRPLDEAQRDAFRRVQRRSLRRTFLRSGVAHPRVRTTTERVHPGGLNALDALAHAYD